MSQVKTVQYRKWSQLSTTSDPVKSKGMEWILGMGGECAENLNNA